MIATICTTTIACKRCHRAFDKYWDRHRREDDVISIATAGLCMKCAINIRTPQNWNAYELGAQGRNDYKLKKQQEAKK